LSAGATFSSFSWSEKCRAGQVQGSSIYADRVVLGVDGQQHGSRFIF